MSAKTKYLQIRVSPEEKERIRALADRAGLDLSSYVLARALPDLQASLERIVERLALPGEFSHPLAEWNDRLTAAEGPDIRDLMRPEGLEDVDVIPRNYLAAMIEHAAHRAGVRPPEWTAEIEPSPEPWFPASSQKLRDYLLAVSPVPFRRRNIFIDSSLGDRV